MKNGVQGAKRTRNWVGIKWEMWDEAGVCVFVCEPKFTACVYTATCLHECLCLQTWGEYKACIVCVRCFPALGSRQARIGLSPLWVKEDGWMNGGVKMNGYNG